MNITHARMLTRLRTGTLVAGLTALVIVLGALIRGVFAWLFAAIAVGANVIGYFYSDRIAPRAVRAQPLTEAQAPEVYGAVRELGSGAPLANALDEIARDRAPLQVNPVSAPMYIVNPLSGAGASSLFSTHPPVRERIRRLRAYDQSARANVLVLRPGQVPSPL